MNTSPGIGIGCSILLSALSAVSGAAVSLFLIVSLSPLVDLFPANSGAQGIALGLAVMWGLVVAATVAVYAFGSVRRARRAADDAGLETDWENQGRYVPLAGARIARAEPYPVHFRDAWRDEGHDTHAALESRLRRMEAMMASNLYPADDGRAGQARPGRAAPPPLTGASLRQSNDGSGASAGYCNPPRLRARR